MSAAMRPRIPTALVAACAAMTLVAGCGGPAIEEAGSTGVQTVDAAVTSTVPIVPDAPAAGTSAAPAGKASSDGATSGAGTTGATGTTTGAVKATAGETSQGNRAKTGGGQGPAKAGSAVERLVAAHPVFGGTAPCTPATLSEVPIGNVSTLSGVLGELFSPVRPALDTFVAAQNACGGLNGHRIKLYFEDDQGDPSTASSKVQAMIATKKILAFVGNIQVLTIDAIVPVIKRHGIPIIGGDLASHTWFQNPLMFPQGPPGGSIAYGYLVGATQHFKKTNIGDMWCIEVPRGCEQNDRALKELAPQFGATMKKSIQASITAPSYVQQCLEFQRSGVEVLALLMDAASMNRMARSCVQVGYHPDILPTSLGVANEKQFLTGNEWLGDSYIALQFFPWMANETPAQKYWQDSMRKYNPGSDVGVASSAGWLAGALLVAAAAELSPTNPSTADLLSGLYRFQGQKWTGLGGLAGPRTFTVGSTPRIPYCFFSVISNAANTGWASSMNTPQCTDKLAPSDPQLAG